MSAHTRLASPPPHRPNQRAIHRSTAHSGSPILLQIRRLKTHVRTCKSIACATHRVILSILQIRRSSSCARASRCGQGQALRVLRNLDPAGRGRMADASAPREMSLVPPRERRGFCEWRKSGVSSRGRRQLTQRHRASRELSDIKLLHDVPPVIAGGEQLVDPGFEPFGRLPLPIRIHIKAIPAYLIMRGSRPCPSPRKSLPFRSPS
jgi:hypothetical protein